MLLKRALSAFRMAVIVLKVAVSASLGVMVYGLLHNNGLPEWVVIIVASAFGGNLGPILADMGIAMAIKNREETNDG